MPTLDDYSPAPFWFLNHKLEKEEILWQLKKMKEQHVKAFFMHPRAGLRTPYGSNEWFEIIRFTAIEAAKLGLKPWLYDEDPFPSGPAGGRIFMEHPEFRARELTFQEFSPKQGEISADLGTGKLLEAIAVRCDKENNVLESQDVFDDIGVLRDDFFRTLWPSPYYHHLFGKETYNHYRAETFHPHLQIHIPLADGWKLFVVTAKTVTANKYDGLPDNLNPACVQEFIRLTHEKYKEKLGDLFGNTIPGIFTDETACGGSIAWTPNLETEFRKRRHVELKGRYHEIFRGNSETARLLREAYWKTVYELFTEAFFIPVNNWCKANHLLLCGHGIGEEFPIATTNGMNIFGLQKYTGIPGFDHITPNIPNWNNFTSLNLGGKLVASAAEQNGAPRVMSECFGCNAFNFNQDGMRRNMRWLYSLGINMLVPHGFHYSYDGFRKDDAGKSFFFQSPDYDNFHEFASYAKHLGMLLGESRSRVSVCLAYPENSFRRLIPAERNYALELMETLYSTVQALIQNQIPFELADEESLKNAEILKNGFRCGLKTYKKLLCPFDFQRDWLEKFKPFLAEMNDILTEKEEFAVLNAITGQKADTVMVQYRTTERGRLLYIFHNSPKRGVFSLRLAHIPGGLCRYGEDMTTLFCYPENQSFDLPAYGAALFEMPDKPLNAKPYPDIALPDPDLDFLVHPVWDYIPQIPGIAVSIKDWNVTAGNEQYPNVPYNRIREIAGTEAPEARRVGPRTIFDLAPVRKKFYPTEVTFESCFSIPDASGNWTLLFENDTIQGQADILLNGKRLPTSVRCKVYDAWNREIDISGILKSGKNVLQFHFANAGEYDGLTSMIYVRRKPEQ